MAGPIKQGQQGNEVLFLQEPQNQGMSKLKKFTIALAVIIGLGLILAPTLSSFNIHYESHVDAAGTRMEHMWAQIPSSYGSIALGATIELAVVGTVALIYWLRTREKKEKTPWTKGDYFVLILALAVIAAIGGYAIAAGIGKDNGTWESIKQYATDKGTLVLKDSRDFLTMGNTDGIILGASIVILGALGALWIHWLRSKEEDQHEEERMEAARADGGARAGVAPQGADNVAAPAVPQKPKKPKRTAEERAAAKKARAERNAVRHAAIVQYRLDTASAYYVPPRSGDPYEQNHNGAAGGVVGEIGNMSPFEVPPSPKEGSQSAARPQPSSRDEDDDLIPTMRRRPAPSFTFPAQPLPGPAVR